MRIFVYEYLTARGVGRTPGSPDHGMYLEGRAMRDAVVEDFKRIPGTAAFAFPDEVAPVAQESFDEMCKVSDWTIIIAPAFDDCLGHYAESVQRVGGHLLGPSLHAIRLPSDKFELFNHWRRHNIPTPATTERGPTGCEAFPVVWKPRDGAGSTMTFLLASPHDVVSAHAKIAAENHRGPMILQEFVPGRAASVAFLCGPAGNIPLLPASQVLSKDGRFQYLGGEIPLSPDLARRAVQLGQRAVNCVPGLKGFIGVDLVLGQAEDESQDFAIEINPRLTTSYVGLRSLAEFNLAEAMVQVATNNLTNPLTWRSERIRFASAGSVE